MGFFKSAESEGERLARELEDAIGSIADRAKARASALESRLAELEQEKGVVGKLLKDMGF